MSVTRLVLPAAVRAGVVEYCSVLLPDEGCGLLAGSVTGQVAVVSRWFGVPNVVELGSARVAYVMNPLVQVKVWRDVEAAGLSVVGVFHSHPDGPAVLSWRDRSLALDDELVQVVVGFVPGPGVDVRAWRVLGGSVRAGRRVGGVATRVPIDNAVGSSVA